MPTHIIGTILSALGIILTSIGVFGDDRIKRWESGLRNFTRSERALTPPRFEQAEQDAAGCFWGIGVVIALIIYGFTVFTDYQRKIFDFVDNSTLGLYIMAFFFCLPFVPIGLFLVASLIQILFELILLPYRLLDKVVEKNNMQSTIVVLGIIVSIIGLLLLEAF